MNEYYSYLLTIYIANLILLLLHSVRTDILHNKVIERRPERDDFFIGHKWRWKLRNGSYKNIGKVWVMPWHSVFVVMLSGFIATGLLVRTEKLWPYWIMIVFWSIALSAPLWIWIYDNLSISVGWG